MSRLSAVHTALGRVELHHEDGRFTTRRVVRCVEATLLTGGRGYVCEILLDRERARAWHELAERQGTVYEEFPEAVRT
jgi:hypothetical protein